MEIIIADNAGFCFGVKRAINMTEEELDVSDNTFSYGDLIHNPQEVNRLKEKGLTSIEDYTKVGSGSIIVRSHGVKKNILSDIEDLGLKLVDCTCPYVKSVYKKVEEYLDKGYDIIIIGNPEHPEIIGINGHCNDEAYIINSLDEVDNLPNLDKVCVVSQTTNTLEKFQTISNKISEKFNQVEVFNTICNATRQRQQSTEELSQQVDAMIIIGGFNSSNTQKLVEVSKKHCRNVFHIETIKDLSLKNIKNFNKIGISAGASTPDWIIKEAVNVMDNFDQNEMMEAIESSFTKINRGDILTGTVLYVTNNEVMVNINYKSDGIIERDELSKDSNVNPKDLYSVGDEIKVYVIKLDDGDGNVVLSTRRVEDLKIWEELEEKFNNKEIIESEVKNVVKGGLTVSVNGLNAFMPASHVSTRFVKDLNKYKGQTLESRIIDFDLSKKRIIVSRKEVEREEIETKREELWGNIEVNDIVEGVVQRLTDFGAFVDIGGVDGLIHISDLSWNRVKHPSDVLKQGDKVKTVILELDKEKNRISLGLKQTVEQPWDIFEREVSEGDIIKGKVVNLLDFGAFVRLESGVDGLLHVSQISEDHIEKPSDVFNIGDEVEVKVVEINSENKRISLSTKELNKEEETVEETESEDNEIGEAVLSEDIKIELDAASEENLD